MAEELKPQPQAQFPTGQQPAQEPPDQWRDEVKKLVTQRDSYKQQAIENAGKVAAYEAEKASIEAEKAARREQDEQRSMIEQGKTKELLKMSEEKWSQKLREKENEHLNEVLPLFIQSAARQVPTLVPGSDKDLAKLLRDDFRRVDGKYVVVDEKGNPRTNADSTPYDPIQYIVDQARSRPHMLMDSMPPSHGAPRDSRPTSSSRSVGDMDNEQLTKTLNTDRAAFDKGMQDYAKELVEKAKSGKFVRPNRTGVPERD